MAYSNAIFFVDDGSVSGTPGSDSARTPLTSCTASNPSGTITRITKVSHGLVTGAVVDLTDFDSWLNNAWKITKIDNDNFDLVGATWQTTGDASGTVTPRGGSSWADAWLTTQYGATSARIQPGDTIRHAKSGDPASVGGAQWTGGVLGDEKAITSSTDATPIVVTATSHGFIDGDYVRIYDHATNTNANGVWRVANKTPNTFELVDPETGANRAGNGAGAGSGGTARNITAQVVYLDAAQTATVDNCEVAWTGVTGYVSDVITVTAGGKGYQVDDILTIDDGPSDATVRVLTVATTGPVLTVAINDGGTGYTIGDTLFIQAGDNAASVSVTATSGLPDNAVTAVTVLTGGTGYSVASGLSTTGGTGITNCLLDVLTVDDGDVLTVDLEDQSALGGYTAGSGVATLNGSGTGCTLDIAAVSAGNFTLKDNASGWESPQGDKHIEFQIGSNLVAGGIPARLCYRALPSTLDLSSYSKLSFWAYANGDAPAANEWKLCLCSDSSGQTVVDTIKLTALPASQKWYPLTLARVGGGNFGASIQSIALYSDTATALNATIEIDNIIACTASGLNLQSLITKNSAAHGGSEYAYSIESISGRVVMLGSFPTSNFVPKGSARRGYIGTTANVTTYIRKPIISIQTSGYANRATDNGAYGNNILYSGGWDPVGGTQNGTTIFDGHAGTGTGFYTSKAYNTVERFQFSRYDTGLRIEDSAAFRNTITDVVATHCLTQGVVLNNCELNTIESLRANYCVTGLSMAGCTNNTADIDNLTNCVNGVTFSAGAADNVIEDIACQYCSYGAYMAASSDNEIKAGTFSNCTAGVFMLGGHNYGRGLTFTSCTYDVYPYPSLKSAKFDSKSHDGTGQNYLFDQGVEVVSQATTRSGGSGLMWGITLTSPMGPYRDEGWPYYLPVAQVPVEANLLVTASLWMQKSDAADIEGSFICKGDQVAGVPLDVETVKAADTSWENVTITFTPTARGVVELGVKVWFVTSAPQTVYIDDISISQAV
jgi:hypothetical protein